MTAKGEGRSGIQSQSSSAAVTAAAAAALYGTSAAAISEARVGLIDASQLPSEAKRAFMSRLMSATLIELTSKDTLAMVNSPRLGMHGIPRPSTRTSPTLETWA